MSALDQLQERGLLREVDVLLAARAAAVAGDGDPLVRLGAALAGRATASGHACVRLDAPWAAVDSAPGDGVAWPDPVAWGAALRGSALVACPPDESVRPLVLDGDRLYLRRYWRHEGTVARALAARAARVRDDVDEPALAAGLARLFGALPDEDDRQRAAAESGVRRDLTVVTGGPGTGKTFTVVRLLGLLALQGAATGRALRVSLAAPTGKAAARMMEAIRDGLGALDIGAEARAGVPLTATTLHRLLRIDPRRPVRAHHHADHPLACDVLVVDEVSMVDLALMARLLDALPAHARLVLVGDPRQLASVEAGAVLADACGDGAPPAALAGSVVRLVRPHRFGAGSGIGRLAAAVDAGDAEAAVALLHAGEQDLAHVAVSPGARDLASTEPARALVVDAWRASLASGDPAAMLDAVEGFRVLAAHREGGFGVAGLNETIVRWLAQAGLVRRDGPEDRWWHGRPFVVTRNDYALELYNGDTGVLVHDARGHARAWVRRPDGGVRDLAPARLPAHETAYAMTVHASQGSEFARVLLVLPPRPSPVLTRELLYTAATRARRSLAVAGGDDVLRAAVAARTVRASGLREALDGMAVAGG